MIEYTHPNGTKMRVQAICDWTIGIRILQEFNHIQRGPIVNEIQLNVDQAEAIIEELKAAIAEHKRIDDAYDDYQRQEEQCLTNQSNMVENTENPIVALKL